MNSDQFSIGMLLGVAALSLELRNISMFKA